MIRSVRCGFGLLLIAGLVGSGVVRAQRPVSDECSLPGKGGFSVGFVAEHGGRHYRCQTFDSNLQPAGVAWIEVVRENPQAVAQVPVVSKDPAVQRTVETQLAAAASVRLDPNARVTSLSFTARPLREILDGVAKASGITLRYASAMTSLDRSSTVTLSDKTVEDALRAVLEGHAMTFQATGPKTAFIYPDTAANRDKYTASIRVFPIAKAELAKLTQQLNQTLKPTADGFRALVLTVNDSRTIIVRAVPELMAGIAMWIAEHDKDQW